MKTVALAIILGLSGFALSQEEEHLNGKSISYSKNESNEIERVVSTKQALEVSVYPNPAQGQVFIEASEGANVSIYSAAGTYIGTWTIGPEAKLSIEDLPQGSFVCSILEGEKRTVKKLVIL